MAKEELESRLRAVLEPQLEQGEELRGACVATQQSTFKGRMVGIGVTGGRLLVQPLNRKFEASEEAISLRPEQIAEVDASGAGGGWPTVSAAVMDGTAVTLRLKTTDGEKLKLMLMRGTGALGKLGGGKSQRQGIEALATWFAANAPS
jgi:hypothetical protein